VDESTLPQSAIDAIEQQAAANRQFAETVANLQERVDHLREELSQLTVYMAVACRKYGDDTDCFKLTMEDLGRLPPACRLERRFDEERQIMNIRIKTDGLATAATKTPNPATRLVN